MTIIINRRITTRADVEAIQAQREDASLEFKGKPDPAEWWELAKDVAAFANHMGGVILVGAFERADKLPELVGLDPATIALLAERYDKVARDSCSPAVVATTNVIEWDNGKELLAVNVQASPASLVGARFYAPNRVGAPTPANAWQFPVRIGDDNVPLTPEQFPMYMNSAIRRVAILLEGIPQARRASCMIAHRKPRQKGNIFAPFPGELCGYDFEKNIARLRAREDPEPSNEVTVPLDDVEAVWQGSDGVWFIRVAGYFEWIEMLDEPPAATSGYVRRRPEPRLYYIPPGGP